jgi:hypothetical protein
MARLTWNSYANELRLAPFDKASLMSLTKPAFSFLAALPFSALSALFWETVPKNKWFGLTQAGLSQVWQTHSPSGIEPL